MCQLKTIAPSNSHLSLALVPTTVLVFAALGFTQVALEALQFLLLGSTATSLRRHFATLQ